MLRGRPRLSLAVVGLLAATSVSSQVLKSLLAYPRYDGVVDGAHVDPAAFPSGHATAAMSLALAFVLVVPPRARPFAAVLGMAFAITIAFCVITLGWHFPSDVVGGFLLATGWTLVIAAGLRAANERWPERAGRTRLTAVAPEGRRRRHDARDRRPGAARGRGGGSCRRDADPRSPGDLVDFADEHTALVAVGGAVALAAAALLGGVTAALRRT